MSDTPRRTAPLRAALATLALLGAASYADIASATTVHLVEASSQATFQSPIRFCDLAGNCSSTDPITVGLRGSIDIDVERVSWGPAFGDSGYDRIDFSKARVEPVANAIDFELFLLSTVIENNTFASSQFLPLPPGTSCFCVSTPSTLSFTGSWDGDVLSMSGVVYGDFAETTTFSLVATAVPEPASSAMFAAGLGLLLVSGRRWRAYVRRQLSLP